MRERAICRYSDLVSAVGTGIGCVRKVDRVPALPAGQVDYEGQRSEVCRASELLSGQNWLNFKENTSWPNALAAFYFSSYNSWLVCYGV